MSALVWHWPQVVMASLFGFVLFAAAMLDGEPKTGKHSFSITLFVVAAELFVLWQGGFWAGASP